MLVLTGRHALLDYPFHLCDWWQGIMVTLIKNVGASHFFLWHPWVVQSSGHPPDGGAVSIAKCRCSTATLLFWDTWFHSICIVSANFFPSALQKTIFLSFSHSYSYKLIKSRPVATSEDIELLSSKPLTESGEWNQLEVFCIAILNTEHIFGCFRLLSVILDSMYLNLYT